MITAQQIGTSLKSRILDSFQVRDSKSRIFAGWSRIRASNIRAFIGRIPDFLEEQHDRFCV
jgi:hypothetical protein